MDGMKTTTSICGNLFELTCGAMPSAERSESIFYMNRRKPGKQESKTSKTIQKRGK
ncbi:MAG: hypothetical protein OEW84_05395 [Aigarchaeota archaeon]|nr:hypothetical protein [Aigarchaeota archaeon]